jgi:hypothetical protein
MTFSPKGPARLGQFLSDRLSTSRGALQFESKNRELFEPPVVQTDFRMMFFGMEKAVSWPSIAAALAGFEPQDRLAITTG